jgi:hypothetical protein
MRQRGAVFPLSRFRIDKKLGQDPHRLIKSDLSKQGYDLILHYVLIALLFFVALTT